MLDPLVALIVDESKWLTASMGTALLAVTVLLHRHRHAGRPGRRRVLAAMNLFFGVTIGAMAFGHLLAVTTKFAAGTLEGSVPVFFLIGIALAVPSWWLIHHAWRVLTPDGGHGRATLWLNAWLAITLLGLGIPNLPLAAPGLLNIWYQLHSGRVVGWAIVTLAVVVNLGLFIGSLIFMASGQGFEKVRGIR
jgi:hypothetical protein